MTKRKQLLWVSAWNICCSMKETETSFWSMLLEDISPGVCTVIQGQMHESAVETSVLLQTEKESCHTSASKVMLTLFLNHHGPLVINWLPKVITVSTELYSGTLECSKSPSMISHGIILIYDNARPKSA